MANLVVYYSQYGNTKIAAEIIAENLGGKAVNAEDFKPEMLHKLSLLVVGSPIHAWRPSKPIIDFLASLPPNVLKGINVAAFDTRIKGFLSGSASDKIDKKLVELGGKSVVAPEKFIVKGTKGPLAEGELENAAHWARHILENMKA